jgi:dCTP diphosphatase
MNLEKIMNEIRTFSKDRDWDQYHSVKNLTMALSVECSELVEIFQWLSEKESNEIAKNEQLIPKVRDEVADILIYLFRITDHLNIDIEEAIFSKMKKNALKYPVELARGNSKKYDEF